MKLASYTTQNTWTEFNPIRGWASSLWYPGFRFASPGATHIQPLHGCLVYFGLRRSPHTDSRCSSDLWVKISRTTGGILMLLCVCRPESPPVLVATVESGFKKVVRLLLGPELAWAFEASLQLGTGWVPTCALDATFRAWNDIANKSHLR